MRENTFDVPAYKFAIMKFDEDISYLADKEELFKDKIKSTSYDFIPFENLDGLLVKDVMALLHQTKPFFVLACYTDFTALLENKRNTINFYVWNLFVANFNSSVKIDEAFEQMIINNYNNWNQEIRKICCCFLERYMDKNHEETLERIRKLKDSGNN